MDDSKEVLRTLTGKKNIVFTSRGNTSILATLKYAKNKGYNTILIQDQGGWMTYPQYISRLKLNEVRLTTNYGLINLDELKNYKDVVLLVNSMAGYCALHDMKAIADICKKNKIFLINDVSGSIGTDQAQYGDLIFGSFGKWKPINLHDGAFIAMNGETEFFTEYEYEVKEKELFEKLSTLDYKLKFYEVINHKIKAELKGFDIVHKSQSGINVIVKFKDEAEKKTLIDYCVKHHYEFVECPKYIRVTKNAISIEVKRLDK